MLTDLAIRHFRSIYDVRIQLKPITLVIGPNASGKSNLFKALRFLHDAVAGDVREWQSYDSQIDELRWFGADSLGDRPEEIEVALGLRDLASMPALAYSATFRAGAGRPLEVKAEYLRPGELSTASREFWLDRSDRQVRRHVGPAADSLKPPKVETARSARNLTLRDEGPSQTIPGLGPVYRHVEGWRFFEIDPQAARRPSFIPEIPEEIPPLAGDASNLSAFLYALWRLRNQDLDAVVEAVSRSVELPQKIQLEHDADRGGTQATYFFFEAPFGESRPVRPDSISDGTIRFLAQMSLLLADQTVTLACLEEPDHGLHPRLMLYLADVLRQAVQEEPAAAQDGQRLQVLIATHSPELMDCFDLASESGYLQVLVAERTESGKTLFIPVTAEQFAPWLERYRLGEAVRRHFL
jgi:predicted ATPase